MSDGLEKRASDAERELAVERLRQAAAEGRLTFEELADRTALAYRARSHAELEPLTADLPASASPPAPAAPRRRWHLGVLVPVGHSGRGAIGERNVAVTLFAPVRLDLRDAHLRTGEVEITVFSLFAPIFVTVPEHVNVDSSIVPVLAPVHDETSGGAPPHAPRVRVRGLSLFGPIFVRDRR
jgi:DUF1707 SHOCT-like domain